MWKVVFCRSKDGKAPFEDHLDGLDAGMRAKTLRSVQLLRTEGPRLREPDTKPLGDGLFELRTTFGGLQGRSIFFFFDGQSIVITHGFLKKTRKTPPRELERARRLRTSYLRQRREPGDG